MKKQIKDVITVRDYHMILDSLNQQGVPYVKYSFVDDLKNICEPKYGEMAICRNKYYIFVNEWKELVSNESISINVEEEEQQ